MAEGSILNRMGWTVELALDHSILGLQIIGSLSVSGNPTPQKLSTAMCLDNIGLLHMPKNFEQDANIAKGMKRPTH